MGFHTTTVRRCLVWILRIAAEEHHASRFGFYRHHFDVLLVWRCLEDEFATMKILQEQKTDGKVEHVLWKTWVFFFDVFCVLKMEVVDLIFLIKTGSKKDQELIYQHIFVGPVAKQMWNKKNNFSELYLWTKCNSNIIDKIKSNLKSHKIYNTLLHWNSWNIWQ